MKETNDKLDEIGGLVHNLVKNNSQGALSQEEYQTKYDAYDKQLLNYQKNIITIQFSIEGNNLNQNSYKVL